MEIKGSGRAALFAQVAQATQPPQQANPAPQPPQPSEAQPARSGGGDSVSISPEARARFEVSAAERRTAAVYDTK